jgi:hypothetical protein
MATENVIINFISNMKGFVDGLQVSTKHMKGLFDASGKLNKQLTKNMTTGMKLGLRFKKAMLGLRGFRMEMLSVMFFGMGMQRFFMGLLTPVLQVTGVFELFSAVLQVLFLPIIEVLLPYILYFAERLMNAKRWVKLLIGWLAILGVVLGLGLKLFGAIVLGIGGLIMAFSGLWNIVSKFLQLLLPDQLAAIGSAMLLLIPSINIVRWAMEKFKEIWGTVQKMISPFWDEIKSKVSEMITHLKKELKKHGFDVDEWSTKIDKLLGDDGIKGLWDDLKDKWDNEMKPMFDDFNSSLRTIVELAPSVESSLKTIANAIDAVANALKFFVEHPKITGPALIGGILGGIAFGPLGAFLGTVGLGILGGLASRQTGGFIPHTGFYKLHAGETVVPAYQTFNSSPTINIYASEGMDVRALAQEVSSIVTSDLGRLARR